MSAPIRKTALAITIVIAATGCKPEPGGGNIYPIAIEISMEDGVVKDDCASQKGVWSNVSTRDLTDMQSPETGEACLVPVDGQQEHFVLSSISCTRYSNITAELTEVTFSLFTAGTGVGATPTLAMTPSTPSAALGFGTGLPLHVDLRGYINRGGAHCTIVGYYTAIDDRIAQPRQ